ncbi:Lar family restriction alleviation protein [Marinimicrobium locisalis]|uniref:Lar family restriction alleviation protein n=1 Tax=Marinimicrobium locisalis TaxID=546022 RepID=UPI00322168A2
MAIALEPCPFCHSNHLHFAHSGLDYCVVCQSCKSKGPHQGELESAIGQWNQASRAAFMHEENQEGASQPQTRYCSARG